jgi:hypothetical protein
LLIIGSGVELPRFVGFHVVAMPPQELV